MSMDQFLAEYYGTNKTASAVEAPAAEDLEKQATVDLFLKLAAEQNIDLKAMTDAQVQQLYSTFSEKVAAGTPAAPAPAAAPAATKTASEKKLEEHEKKLEEAKKEHEEKHAMAKKAEEADIMGRIMAHAYVHELKKIAAEATKTAELPPALLEHMKGKEEHKPEHDGKEEKKHEEHEEHKEHEEKKASALDELGAQRAVAMAKEANFDEAQAQRKIAAVLELGLCPQTTKTASVADVQEAIGIRALELLEKAGYPVTWNGKAA
jgi:hypothetical protein